MEGHGQGDGRGRGRGRANKPAEAGRRPGEPRPGPSRGEVISSVSTYILSTISWFFLSIKMLGV